MLKQLDTAAIAVLGKRPENSTALAVELLDQSDNAFCSKDECPPLRIVLLIDPDGISIRCIDRYGTALQPAGLGEPIYIEYDKGDLRVLIWGDINQEDPTERISLNDNAREINRESSHG